MNLNPTKLDIEIKPGDIILTALNASWFLKGMKFLQKDPVLYSHCLIAKDNYFAYESKVSIRISNIREIIDKCDAYVIVRKKNFTPTQKDLMNRLIKDLVGRPYSYKRLFLQIMDNIFQTTKFTKMLKSIDNQVCSSLVAWIYYILFDMKFNDKNWYSADPDDISDEIDNNKNNWIIIAQNVKES